MHGRVRSLFSHPQALHSPRSTHRGAIFLYATATAPMHAARASIGLGPFTPVVWNHCLSATPSLARTDEPGTVGCTYTHYMAASKHLDQ